MGRVGIGPLLGTAAQQQVKQCQQRGGQPGGQALTSRVLQLPSVFIVMKKVTYPQKLFPPRRIRF